MNGTKQSIRRKLFRWIIVLLVVDFVLLMLGVATTFWMFRNMKNEMFKSFVAKNVAQTQFALNVLGQKQDPLKANLESSSYIQVSPGMVEDYNDALKGVDPEIKTLQLSVRSSSDKNRIEEIDKIFDKYKKGARAMIAAAKGGPSAGSATSST